MAVFHYSRVSNDTLTTENQQHTARISGYTVDHWYADDGVSGAVRALERPQFAEMMKHIKEGDTLIVSAADRIGRNTVDVISTVERFQAMKVKVIILAYGSLDLTSDIGMVVLSLAATFAQLERSGIQARTKAGLARTKAQGTKLGAPLKMTPKELTEICQKAEAGMNYNQLGKEYGYPRLTIERNVSKWGGKLEAYEKEYALRKKQYEAKGL